MRLKPSVIVIGLLLASALSFQNCAKTDFASTLGDEASLGLDANQDGRLPAGDNGGGVIPTEDIAVNCKNQTLKPFDQKIDFEKPNRCDWGLNGNLSAKDGYAQARSEQRVELDLPSNAVICKLEFEFVKQDMLYDDQFMMTYNNFVLASSFKGLVEFLPQVDGLYKYDWSALKGKRYSVSGFAPFVAGSADGGTINMPKTQENGKIEMKVADATFYKFASKKSSGAKHAFGFVTTGDNDDKTDCQHLPVNFNVKGSYYIP